jgi:hypothetical protein
MSTASPRQPIPAIIAWFTRNFRPWETGARAWLGQARAGVRVVYRACSRRVAEGKESDLARGWFLELADGWWFAILSGADAHGSSAAGRFVAMTK